MKRGNNQPNPPPEWRACDDPVFQTLRDLWVAVWVYDIDNGRIAFANKAALALWDADKEEELRARDLKQGMSQAVSERLRQYQRDFIDRAAQFTENWTLYPKGKPVSLNILYTGYPLSDGRMAMMCQVLNELRDDPDNLRRTDALLHADVMVTMFEENGPPIYFNPAARKVARSVTQHFSEMFVNAEDYDDLMFGMCENGQHRIVARVVTAEGETWHDVSSRRCLDPATGQPAVLVTAIDVNELKSAKDTARYLAETDPLTSCHNRNYLNDRLDNLMKTGSASGSGLLYFDLDRFKQINDSFGHHVGDLVLHAAAARLMADVSENETLARLGGDEFVLLVESIETEAALLARAEDVRTSLQEPIINGATRLNVTTSVGAALIADDVVDWSEAMRRADIALYHSKFSGRNCCSLFSEEMGRAALKRAQLESDLAAAIQFDQFVLHYQPRVQLGSGRVESVEALVRWNHPQLGMVSPGHFIPLCEETGMIEVLGAKIIEKACAQALRWHQAGVRIRVSINVSPRQFQSAELIDAIETAVSWKGFQPSMVEFEITESVLVDDDIRVTERLNDINALGFHIAVDDFGTGYSNLSNITRFPLNCIKIDKSFVDKLPESQPVVELIVTLAKKIGATVVAEGAEYETQVDELKRLSCDQVQGFHFSKPVAADRLPATVRSIEEQHVARDRD